MIARRQYWVPAFLFACLILGGSAQAVWGNFLLRLAAVVLLCAALWTPSASARPAARNLIRLLIAAVALILLQLVPLPAAVWTMLPGREFVAKGFDLLSLGRPWQSLSLAPYETIAAGLFLLVPAAVVVATVRGAALSRPLLAAAILAATLTGSILAVLQVNGDGNAWYFYRYSSFGQGSGFFANSNHMATLLLVSLPFLLAFAADRWDRTQDRNQRSLIIALGLGGALLLAVGIALNGSFAILVLGLPAALASAFIPRWSRRPSFRKAVLPAAALLLVATAALAVAQRDRLDAVSSNSWTTRQTIWSTSLGPLQDFALTGSGAGTFAGLYRRYEVEQAVPGTYVNNAHNDYLELAIEDGLPGLVLLGLFLLWWARRTRAAWRGTEPDYYARAAAVASATILLHAVVDFPLRTEAIAALFAACAALLAMETKAEPVTDENDLWPSRHLSF